MADRYSVVVPCEWERNGKKNTKWVTVGSAFYNEKKGWYSVMLDLPIGATRFMLMPPKDKSGPAPGPDDGGEIPF